MFFYSCSQWPSCFSNVDTFTLFTRVNVSTFVRHLESTECRVLGSQRGIELLCTLSVLTMNRLHRPQHDSAATIPDYVTVEHPCDAICNHKRAKTVDAAAVCSVRCIQLYIDNGRFHSAPNVTVAQVSPFITGTVRFSADL